MGSKCVSVDLVFSIREVFLQKGLVFISDKSAFVTCHNRLTAVTAVTRFAAKELLLAPQRIKFCSLRQRLTGLAYNLHTFTTS